MKILILEDEPLIAHSLKNVLNNLGYMNCSLYGEYRSACSALKFIRPDLAFIDIQLSGEQKGIEFAKQCNLNSIPFIFLTSFDDENTIENAIAEMPISYLLKPFKEVEILVAMSLIKKIKSESEYILIKDGKKEYSLKLKDLLYIEADTPYVKLHTKSGVISVRDSLTNVISYFPKSRVIRVHKSFAVSLKKVQVKGLNHFIINEVKIPISRKYYNPQFVL